MRTLLSLIGVCLASCVAAPPAPPSFALGELAPGPALESAPGYESRPSSELPSPRSAQQSGTRAARPVWRDQQPLMQGFFGAANYESITREASGPVDIELEDTQLPVLGGGAQVKLGGERIDVGLEGLFSLGWRANAAAFAVGGGAAVAVDVDLFVFDLYGGPFVSTFIGEKLRLYAAAGPLMQWANYDESGNGYDDSGSGFGFGTYARAGLEVRLGPGLMVGFGMRWSDSTVDLGNSGNLEVDGLQYLFTVSRGI